MANVYKVKENIDLNEFAKLGYDVTPGEHLILFKFIPQNIDGEAVRFLMDTYYNNKQWKKHFYDKNRKEFIKKMNLRYDKKTGEIIMNDTFEMVLTNWRIEIDTDEDGWVGFKPLDPFNTNIYYGCGILDKFCGEEIKILLEKELIDKIEVD